MKWRGPHPGPSKKSRNVPEDVRIAELAELADEIVKKPSDEHKVIAELFVSDNDRPTHLEYE